MRILSLLAFALLFSVPAMAAPVVDKSGADALKPRIAQTIKQFEDSLKQYGYEVKEDGELTVEPAGTYYAVTTPSFSVGLPNGTTRSVGMVAINAIPTDNPDIIKVALAIPTPMSDRDINGKVVGQISIANQSLNGLWHLGAAMFVQLDAKYAGILAVDTLNGMETAIPSLATAMKLTDNGAGKWSGPTETIATQVVHKAKDTVFSIQNVNLKSVVTGMDIMAERPVAKTAKDGSADAQSMLADIMTRLADAFDSNIALTGIGIKSKQPDGTFKNYQVKSMTLSSAMAGLRSKESTMSWNAMLEGITTDTKGMDMYLPTIMQFKGSSKGVGISDLLTAKDSAAQMDTLSKEGAFSKLDRFIIEAPAYGLDATGSFGASGAQTSSGMKVSLRGLTELLTWISGPDAPKMNGQSIGPAITGVLAMVQMMGKPGTDVQGRPVLTYDFQFGADGKLTLNGADLTQMMGAQKPATPAAPHSAPSAPAAP